MRFFRILFILFWPGVLAAADHGPVVDAVVVRHILPGFETLAETSGNLEAAAQSDCSPESAGLRIAYHGVFDAWLGVSHLRFGPTETGDRAFALAFWPDTKGFTPKTLRRLIEDEDPAVNDPGAFAAVSIAGRGIYALEFLLYDDAIRSAGSAAYRCSLIRAISADIHANAQAILADWQGDYAEELRKTGAESRYRTADEAAQELFKALATGLQFTSDTRLGRPLGSFDKPRPRRAEAWRSGRSLHNVVQALQALEQLAVLLSQEHPAIAEDFRAAFKETYRIAAKLDDPVFAGVADVQGRLRVEILQQSIDRIRDIAAVELGPTLGVAAGFNALDGD